MMLMPLVDPSRDGVQQEICLGRIEPCLGRQKQHYDFYPASSAMSQSFTSSYNLLFDTIYIDTEVIIYSLSALPDLS
jgi:hypothetical protein